MTASPKVVYTNASTPKSKSEDLPEDPKAKIDPKAVREKAELSQEQMATLMGMSATGYLSWEQGERRPGGPAFQLLRLIDVDPQAAIKALQ